ncbi:MAG: glutamine synthetase family protein [Minwuia sp.]|uniref:glutamine synthetase family protein n=1 Tax=Minwuia sp. TaxID=2493630 RepID=UPI003A843D64
MACCSDIAGQVRGKGFPEHELETRLKRGVGWTPTNVQITCFDVIADSPFGALDDLVLVPDPATRFRVDQIERQIEDTMLGDILTLDGQPWSCCTRSALKSALKRLEDVAGASLTIAFEHEFQLEGGSGAGSAYSLEGARAGRALGQRIFDLMAANGLEPDTFMKEYGPDQYEVTMKPADALKAVDNAVILRELVRLAADGFGQRATFTPIRDPDGVGNGVHIHLSLNDMNGEPATHDPESATGLSKLAGSFVAGVCAYLPSIVAFLAPSAISYLRLTPHRWSAAWNNLGLRDREASVRICPVTALDPRDIARQFNFEVRACDAAASPYLQLAAIVHAGAEGIARGLTPPEATHADLDALSEKEIAAMGYRRLPQSLSAALKLFESDETARGWFGAELSDVYLRHKRGELGVLEGLGPSEMCHRYLSVY